MYEWSLKEAGGIGWIAVLVFAVCCALRLARFNTMLEDHDLPAWTKKYFTGVPAPAGGMLALWPLVLVLQFDAGAQMPPLVYALCLMVSRLPTFALKGWRIAPVWVAPVFVAAVAVIAGLVTDTWLAMSGLGILYVVGLPLGWLSYQAKAKKESNV